MGDSGPPGLSRKMGWRGPGEEEDWGWGLRAGEKPVDSESRRSTQSSGPLGWWVGGEHWGQREGGAGETSRVEGTLMGLGHFFLS